MVKFLRTILMACLLLASVMPSQAQKIMGYVEDYRYSNITSQEYGALTDVIYSFLEFNTDGSLIGASVGGTPSTVSNSTFGWDQSAYSTVKNNCKTKKGGTGPRLHIALGGADKPGARAQRFYDVASNATARAKLIDQVVKWAIQEGLYGIALDWEFPTTSQVGTHELLLKDFRTAINNSADPSLILTIDVGGEYKNTVNHLQYVTATALTYIDELHIMSYDLPTSYSANHSSIADAKGALDQWKLTYNFPYNKMLLGVPFYGWDAVRNLNQLYSAEGSYTTAYNKTDESATSGYYYNSKDALNQKVDYVYNKGGQGIVIWAVGGDRQLPDAYSLLNVIKTKTNSRCAPMPSLGPDVGVCLTTTPGGITLNSNVAAQNGRTFTWKLTTGTPPATTTTTLSATGATLSGVTTSGTYTVTVTENGCPNSDDIIVTASNAVTASGGSRCGSGTVTLTASGTGTFNWYDAAVGGTLLSTGATYQPNVTNTTDFYVQDQGTSVETATGKIQMNNTNAVVSPFGKFTTVNGHTDLGHKVVVSTSLNIKEVDFTIAPSMTGTMSFNVVSSVDNKTVLQTAGPFSYNNTSAINGQTYTFPLNLNLAPGTYYIMPVSTTGTSQKYWAEFTGDWSSSTLLSDYTIPGVIAISGNCFNDFNDGLGVRTPANAVYVASIFKWKIRTGSANACGRTKVTATVIPGANAGLTVSTVSPICSGVSGSVTVAASESGISYQAYKGTTAVGAAVSGTGSSITLTIPSANLTAGANTITIQATKTGCGVTTLTNSATITVNAATTPTFTFTNVSKIYGDAAFSMTATSNSGGAMTYSLASSSPTGIVTVASNGQVTISGAGTATIKVDQVANGCYLAGSATATLTIAKATRTATITSTNTGLTGSTVNLTNTISAGTGAATWSVINGTGSATVSGTTLSLVSAGTVTVKVDIAADANYNATSATQTFTINAGTTPTITFNAVTKVFGDAPFSMTATSNSGGAMTYSLVSSSPTGIVTVASNGQITISGAGTATIKVDQVANGTYGAGSATAILTIGKANRTATITSVNSGAVGTTVTLTNTVSAGTGAATWSVVNGTGSATVSGTTLSLLTAGTVTVKVDIAADANYNATSATQTFTINKANRTATITSASSGSVGGTVSLTNIVSAGTGAATWSVVNGTGSATVSGTTLSLLTAGTVTVKVDIAADANYNATSATQSFTIGNGSGTPTPGPITGPSNITKGQSATYCVPNVPGTTYTWDYTGYNVMIQDNNTNCVTITFNDYAVGGTLSVTANNGSGESLPRELLTTGIEDEIAGLKFEVFPNPFEFSSTISFDLPYGAIVDIDVYSMHGVKVKTLVSQAALSSGNNSFTLSEIPNGIYIVRLKIGNSEKNIKVVKN